MRTKNSVLKLSKEIDKYCENKPSQLFLYMYNLKNHLNMGIRLVRSALSILYRLYVVIEGRNFDMIP
ncbi:hypothetical protein C922_05807 [Plasmodium inui San Antonio 1]|uniref:Uncharacterized protein n=1 Tax=Plasmodium inui San Antonio 1 TaxID=1237626 RepID=W7A3Z7_9APIC|nr:hypothetical protein C922_05807 [Plasmodium inui San Antonio 1]EUD63814.1 hypothetical protein C922_05807 [Plasmodium inui San Antonio 1]